MMKHANSRAIVNYWQALRGRANAPMQRDLRPADIKTALPQLFVLQRFDADHFVFRLAGTGYCSLFGREFRMQNILSIAQGPQRRYLGLMLDRVLDLPCMGIADVRIETLSGLHAEMEYIFLPLADADGRINRLLGTANIVDWGSASVYDRFARQSLTALQIKDIADLPPAEPIKRVDPVPVRPAARSRTRLELVASQETPIR